MQFPIFKTKNFNLKRNFNLTDLKEQKEYFNLKAGEEIKKLRKYLEKNTFIAYLLGKKNSGKGTYAKMFAEIVSPEKIDHFSIGDMIRGIDKELMEKSKKKELISFLEKNYRGFVSLEEIIKSLEERSTKNLLPTDLILSLVKREMGKKEKKSLFIDGFPRDLDQINFSLFFRDLVGYRDDPDVFVLIDLPEEVIDERIKWRRICPTCNTSRNLKLLPTSKVCYIKNENKKDDFYLVCDNLSCQEEKMIPKEGDELGVAPIKERLERDEKLIKQAMSLYGIPKVFLRNSIPKKLASKYVDNYEITPEYCFQWDEKNEKVEIKERPWLIKNNEGEELVSLLAQPVVVSLIKQMVQVLKI